MTLYGRVNLVRKFGQIGTNRKFYRIILKKDKNFYMIFLQIKKVVVTLH